MSKSKILFLVISIIFCIILSGCELIFGLDHDECIYSEWVTIEDPSCSQVGKESGLCVICFEEKIRDIPKLAHTPVEHEGKAATCTETGLEPGIYCEECRGIIEGLNEIPKLEHTVVIDPAVDPTDDQPGRTEGKHCSTCGEVLVKQTTIFSGNYSNPERYHGDYAYESLLKLENGKGMADFYDEIDAFAADFHFSLNDAKVKENGENTSYYLAEVYFDDNGITSEQALSAWNAYIKDHPIYYWMSSRATYTDKYLTVMVDYEYIDGEVREQINVDLYETIEEYILYLNGEGSTYGITLGLHDVIIGGANYAYEADGVTPSSDTSAHNILGVLLEGEGVCESYAKAFQIFLNYCGIDNVFVTGYAGEAHAWNLVQLDDDKWYWYDLTWDDQPKWMLGVRHNYFCVSAADYVNWQDGGKSGTGKFLDDHTPAAVGGVGVNYSYELPAVSNTPYTYDGLMLRDEIIEKDGLSYVLIGFNKLALIDINKEGAVNIPETVTYNGETLQVACIGKYDEEKRLLITGSVIYYDSLTREHIDVTSITIPATVRFIWDYAFDHCSTIESYAVSQDNPVFTSQNGVLFTKSLYTLIKYPLAKSGASYTVPSETVEIAYGAFGDGGNLFCPEYLKYITIPDSVEVIGAYNGGNGFRNATPSSSKDVISLDGYIDKLYKMNLNLIK